MRNEMMHRPIIDQNVLNFLRQDQQPLTGKLKILEDDAHQRGIPIIPHETVNFFRVLLKIMQPKNILEVGTAIGFSALLMAENTPITTKITTIDRYDVMIQAAQKNFADFGLNDRINLLAGDASDILPTLSKERFDFIFLDSAKAKYIDFLPLVRALLTNSGVILIDDVLQGGTVLQPISAIKHRNHGIHRNLNRLFDVVFHDSNLVSSVLPLGDGLMMITQV